MDHRFLIIITQSIFGHLAEKRNLYIEGIYVNDCLDE